MSSEGHRRDFFTRGLSWLVQSALGDEAASPSSRPVGSSAHPAQQWLRPPGALPEFEFLKTCTRCGECVKSCPANAILPWATDDEAAKNTPVIDARVSPCVICDDLSCMKVCPSGALVLVPTRADIDMGLAEVDFESCVRTHGENCTICIDRCPLGPSAIRLDTSEPVSASGTDLPPLAPVAGRIHVDPNGCTGCGVCQWACPTKPESIRVVSNRNLVKLST